MKTDPDELAVGREVDPKAPVDLDVLERRASAARDRLLDTVDALDQKRHQLTRSFKVIGEYSQPIAIGVGALLVGGVTVAIVISAQRRRRAHFLGFRMPRPRREPWQFGRMFRHVALTVLAFALSESAKIGIKRMLPSMREVEVQKNRAQLTA